MQTILVEINGSGVAARAASIAADLAAALGARLIAVSVFDGVPANADAVHAVQRRVQSLGRGLGIDVDVRTVHGDASDELLQQVRAVAPDLVVVAGNAERPGAIGVTAEQVLATCHVPVLVVPPES